MSDDTPKQLVDDTGAEYGLLWAGILFVLGMLFVAAFLWPTPWEYTWVEDGRVLIRRNRFNDRIEAKAIISVPYSTLKQGEWIQVDPLEGD